MIMSPQFKKEELLKKFNSELQPLWVKTDIELNDYEKLVRRCALIVVNEVLNYSLGSKYFFLEVREEITKPKLRQLSSVKKEEWDIIEMKCSLPGDALGHNLLFEWFNNSDPGNKPTDQIIDEALIILRQRGVDV